MSYPYNEVSSINLGVRDVINLNGNSGTDGYVITNVAGLAEWRQVKGLVSQYVDTTDNVQDLATGAHTILFDTEVFNFANITFTSNDTFTFNDAGIYQLSFQGLLSNSPAQSMVSFSLNGTQVYGNMNARITSTTDPVPIIVQYTLQINQGDVVQVLGEKYNDGPNYLKNNPLYFNPVTQFTITKLWLSRIARRYIDCIHGYFLYFLAAYGAKTLWNSVN